MNVMIGIDPHKASHTAVAIGRDEDQISTVKVRATVRQVDQLLSWAEYWGTLRVSQQVRKRIVWMHMHHPRAVIRARR